MPAKSKTYGELRQDLDTIITQLQDPDIDIDQAAQRFEQALQAVAALEKHLAKAENRIQKVSADFTRQEGGVDLGLDGIA